MVWDRQAGREVCGDLTRLAMASCVSVGSGYTRAWWGCTAGSLPSASWLSTMDFVVANTSSRPFHSHTIWRQCMRLQKMMGSGRPFSCCGFSFRAFKYTSMAVLSLPMSLYAAAKLPYASANSGSSLIACGVWCVVCVSAIAGLKPQLLVLQYQPGCSCQWLRCTAVAPCRRCQGWNKPLQMLDLP